MSAASLSITPNSVNLSATAGKAPTSTGRDDELAGTFQKAVAGMFFGQMMKALRSTVGEPAYIHGGQAEEMFQAQMDQHVVEDLAENSGGSFIGDLYRQFRIQQGLPVGPDREATLLPSGGSRGSFADLNSASLPSANSLGPRPKLLSNEGSERRFKVSQAAASANSTPSALSSTSTEAEQSVQLIEAESRARTGLNRFPVTTVTTAIGSMFRK